MFGRIAPKVNRKILKYMPRVNRKLLKEANRIWHETREEEYFFEKHIHDFYQLCGDLNVIQKHSKILFSLIKELKKEENKKLKYSLILKRLIEKGKRISEKVGPEFARIGFRAAYEEIRRMENEFREEYRKMLKNMKEEENTISKIMKEFAKISTLSGSILNKVKILVNVTKEMYYYTEKEYRELLAEAREELEKERVLVRKIKSI